VRAFLLGIGLAVGLAGGCAGQPSWVALPAPDPIGPVRGMVVDKSGRALPDQIVAIGAEKTTSDGDGRFSFPKMPAGYDLVIASPGGGHVTVYQGLSRRDPIVRHSGPRAKGPVHRAQIFVKLAGPHAGRDSWQVHFVSSRAFASTRDEASAAGAGKTRYPDTLVVTWDGADTIAGVVMAHAMRVQRLDIPLATFAQRQVTIRAGETMSLELAPEKVAVVRRPGAKITVPKNVPPFKPNYTEEYRLPALGFAMHGPGPAASPYDIPDLRAFGMQLCAEAFQWNPYLHSGRTQCGVDIGKLTSFELPAPPAFTAPAWDAFATPEIRFVWTAVPNAVYRLLLEDASMVEGASKSVRPTVEVVTSQTTAGWPDLHAVGISFPTEPGAYAAEIGVHGPFASIDELAGPQGFGDPAPRDRWGAESQPLSIRTRPPGSTEEPQGLMPPEPPPPPEMFQGGAED
jgi:hypothetical protein